ncbi:tetratricopeptide repeat protein [Nocardiopsis metallicus]|uniref:Tetratricopeptide (TPR) repeat protein n=1 Tax=Nocardiopsis metallicus TaxID=179819 RepID=A0A840W3L8_9ACTN|nr:tetratricopeptide repeat protein [Nocardiopsis metallicus]MBB5491469.1 tetratricopeptide (TPR) repeat protein [Nocardiopsis metallicus]
MSSCTPWVVSREAATAAAENFVADHLALARAADRHLDPHRQLLCPEGLDAALFPNYDEALSWSARNSGVLAAAARTAHELDLHEQTWQLCDALGTTARLLLDMQLWCITGELGVASAARCGSAPHALMLTRLGSCHRRIGDLDQAEKSLLRAEALWKQTQDRVGLAWARAQLGQLFLGRGDATLASAQLGRALDGFADVGLDRGVWMVHRRLGEVALMVGDRTKARSYLEGAVSWFDDQGDHYQVVRTSMSLARAHAETGHRDQAFGVLTHAEETARTQGLIAHAEQVQALAAALTAGGIGALRQPSVFEQVGRS